MSPADPDARITKMKDGRTHLAHKAEHAVDLESGALLAVTLQPTNAGDTTTIHQTLEAARATAVEVNARGVEEVVADKGVSQRRNSEGTAWGRNPELHSRTGSRQAELGTQGGSAEANV